MAEHPVPDSSEFFPEVCTHLQNKMRKEQYDTWFRGFTLAKFEPEEPSIEFKLPTTFVRDWIQRNFFQLLQEAVTAAGVSQAKVMLTVGGGDALNGTDQQGVNPDASTRTQTEPSSNANAIGALPREAVAGEALGHAGHANPGRLDPSQLSPGRLRETQDPAHQPGSVGHLGSMGSHAGPQSGPVDAGPSVGGSDAAHGLGNGSPFGKGHTGGGQRKQRNLSLNRNYTFEHFVVGPSNRLSHAAALAIGENPGCSYNPLFIHGNVGLGKTHLLQALCHSIRRRNPSARVVYLTSEEFTNEFIEAIRQGQLESFRAYHREADVLVVDDIQFLASKGKTQEEFFHTFNSLYQHQKQIVLSSDRSPQDIPTLEERLVSRFKWGLVTEIEIPDFETRVAIVQRKARLRGQENGLPDDVAYMIAERIANNIRELEGAVIKVLGTGSILGREVTVELAEEALRGVAKARNQHVNMDRIMEVVTAQFPVSVRDIIGKGRTQAISYPRQIAMFLGRKHTDHSLEEIGKYFGNRDHTTVLYSVNKIAERTEKDRMLKELLDTLSGRLQR